MVWEILAKPDGEGYLYSLVPKKKQEGDFCSVR